MSAAGVSLASAVEEEIVRACNKLAAAHRVHDPRTPPATRAARVTLEATGIPRGAERRRADRRSATSAGGALACM
eukprot:261334-Chlamydomonas_euryale.AAC.5